MRSLAAPADLVHNASRKCKLHDASCKRHAAFWSRNWFIMISLIFVGYHWRWLRSLTLNPISLMLIGRSSNCIACHYFSLAIIDCHPASLTLVGISSIFIGGHLLVEGRWFSSNILDFRWYIIEFHRISWILAIIDFHPISSMLVGISLIVIGCHWFSVEIIDFHPISWMLVGISLILIGYHWFSQRSLIFNRHHWCLLA